MHLCYGIISGDSLRLNYASTLKDYDLCQIDIFTVNNSNGMSCGSPDKPHNGLVKTRFKEKQLFVEFDCKQNYTLVGPKEIRCESSGLWSALSPVCSNTNPNLKIKPKKPNLKSFKNETKVKPKTITCNELDDENGRFSYTKGLSVGSHAILHCNKTFRVSSKSVSECLHTGIWSHSYNYSLKCVQIVCDFINISEIRGIRQIIIKKSEEKLTYSSELDIHCNNSIVYQRICGINGFWVKKDDINNTNAVSDLKMLCQTDDSYSEIGKNSENSPAKTTNMSLKSLIIISSIAAITTTSLLLIIFTFIRYLKKKLDKLNSNIANNSCRRVMTSVPVNDFSLIQIKHNYGSGRRRHSEAISSSYYGSEEGPEVETTFASSVLFNSGRKTSIIHTYSEPFDFDFSGQHIINETSEENIYSEPYSSTENELYSLESKCFD